MNVKINEAIVNGRLFVINDKESAAKVASLLIETLQEIQRYTSGGKTSYHLLKQLKNIVYCIYHTTENEYTASLHEVVSYVLLQIFQCEK